MPMKSLALVWRCRRLHPRESLARSRPPTSRCRAPYAACDLHPESSQILDSMISLELLIMLPVFSKLQCITPPCLARMKCSPYCNVPPYTLQCVVVAVSAADTGGAATRSLLCWDSAGSSGQSTLAQASRAAFVLQLTRRYVWDVFGICLGDVCSPGSALPWPVLAWRLLLCAHSPFRRH